jgi:hypothetical protein
VKNRVHLAGAETGPKRQNPERSAHASPKASSGPCGVPEVHQHMPELSEKSEDLQVVAPLAPLLGVVVQRGCGSPDDRSVQDSAHTGDTLREPRHHWSAEVIWYIANAEPDSSMPMQLDSVLVCKLVQRLPNACARESRVRHQCLNISVKYDGP